jgi:hypothetical protein
MGTDLQSISITIFRLLPEDLGSFWNHPRLNSLDQRSAAAPSTGSAIAPFGGRSALPIAPSGSRATGRARPVPEGSTIAPFRGRSAIMRVSP